MRLVQVAPAYGLFPRHFSFNKAGDMMLVATQSSSTVNVIQRDTETGKVGELLASITLTTNITSELGVHAAVWYE